MIRIFADGKELILNRSTTIGVEISNALFSSSEIEGDISYSFDIPVEGNEEALGFAHIVQTGAVKRIPCAVWCDGNMNWDGDLLVQKTGWDSVSAALIVNPYPDGFADRMMTKNTDTDTVISHSLTGHDAAWRSFITASLSDPDVKFAPFINETGYGSDNGNFGFWEGNARGKVVNALFYDIGGALLEQTDFPFSQMHNKVADVSMEEGTDENGDPSYAEYTEINQLAYCPQIRIARLLEIWCRNAGYRFINHLGGDLNLTFMQSQKSLDGTGGQYESEDRTTIVTRADKWIGTFLWCNSFSYQGQSQDAYVHDGMVHIPTNGWWDLHITADYKADNPTSGSNLSHKHRHPYLKIYTGTHTLAEIDAGDGMFFEAEFDDPDNSHIEVSQRIYVPASVVNAGLKFALYYKVRQNTSGKEWPVAYSTVDMDIRFHEVMSDEHLMGFNIFRRKFNIPELCPEISNGAFLKTMMETMGLCYFVSHKTKQAELVPYRMLKDNAGSLDLSDYELVRETETQSPDGSRQTFRLKPMKEESYNAELRIADVENTLPDPYENHERVVLMESTNTVYRAARQEDESGWAEKWEELGSNPDKLETGEGDETATEPGVEIPHQRYYSENANSPDTDTATGAEPQLAVADFTISSDLYNYNEKPSGVILTQYRGYRERTQSDGSSVFNEVMLPVWGEGFALKAKGENSIGEKYVKPVIELANRKTITYKFIIPTPMMQEVENLLRPDSRDTVFQTRFLMVRNVKSIPKTITFQVDNGEEGTVLCQIDAVRVYS